MEEKLVEMISEGSLHAQYIHYWDDTVDKKRILILLCEEEPFDTYGQAFYYLKVQENGGFSSDEIKTADDKRRQMILTEAEAIEAIDLKIKKAQEVIKILEEAKEWVNREKCCHVK